MASRKQPRQLIQCADCDASSPPAGRRWLQVVGMFILVLLLYIGARETGLTGLSAYAGGAAGYGAVFVLGLLASTSSCLALVGGLLLSVSAVWAQSQARQTHWNRLEPLLFFNTGRLIGYFVLGGLVGMLGGILTLTQQTTGILTILLAVVMIILGLRMLQIVPKRFCRIPLPRRMQDRIRDLAQSRHPLTAILLGALTFFLPCGFTQSTQLIALASGNFLSGGLIMLVFALGTLPSLLGISLVSALVEGKVARFFISFSATVAVLLGLVNLRAGLLQTGIDAQGLVWSLLGSPSISATQTNDPFVTIDDQGRQIISMYVSDEGYKPDQFTIEPNRPTWVYAIAKKGLSGCANFLTAPTYNLQTEVKVGGNWMGPIQNPTKDFVLTCSMGMLRANVHVKNS